MKKCCTASADTEKSLSLKPAAKTEGEKPVKNTTDMPLLVGATGGVQ